MATMTQSREVRLASRPAGMPDLSNFEIATVDLPEPAEGEVQVRNTWMSVDPFMRHLMYEGPAEGGSYQVGQVMMGQAIGEVVVSRSDALQVGDLVTSFFGWREGFTAPAAHLQRLDTMGVAPQHLLGAFGMTGLSAWAGLTRTAALQSGDVVFVSGAAGAVGMMAVQIAKLRGATVIGSAGGPEKVALLTELGVDHVIDYKAGNVTDALAAAAPDGIDIYFDNVGGEMLEAAFAVAKDHARFVLCGGISGYNDLATATGPRNFHLVNIKSLHIDGFRVNDHGDAAAEWTAQLAEWVRDGKVQLRETIDVGIEQAPAAFLKLFSGGNTGKMLVRFS